MRRPSYKKKLGGEYMNNKNKRKTIITTCLLACVLLAASFSTFTAATSPRAKNNEIAQYILHQLSYTGNENILCYLWGPVSAGEKILATKGLIFDISCSGYVMYIDPHPTENLFHPVLYVFFNEQTKELQVFSAQSPPQNNNDYRLIDTAYSQFFFSVQNRRASIPNAPDTSTGSSDNRWAVLMNGGYDSSNNHVRYWNDLSNIYITLNTVYEIPDENIIVLCSDGLNPAADQSNGQNSNPDLDGDGDADIMYSCTLANVDMVFTSLANNASNIDKLFVFTTDHGGQVSGWNVIENLWNHEELTDAHFATLLAAFPDSEKICTLEPCNSGGFLDNIVVSPGPIVASSACRYDESSYAMDNLVYDEYVFHWTAAVKGEDAFGVPVNADADGNGIVTMNEAYTYAIAHDVQSESPQYGEYPQDTGSQVSLWVSSNPPAQPTQPAGPALGIWHINYSYTSSATEPDNEQIYYLFDWGDGSTSGWIGPYSSGQTGTGSHIWTVLGTYNVKVKARDIHGAGSVWSDPLVVTITDNTPPDVPEITGPAQGKPGNPYLYNLQSADGQDQNIYYYVDWGDNTTTGWLGPYVSGTLIHVTHTWDVKGTYIVKAKAKDTMDSESDWGTLSVNVPYRYATPLTQLWEQLLARFPNAFPILRHLMGY